MTDSSPPPATGSPDPTPTLDLTPDEYVYLFGSGRCYDCGHLDVFHEHASDWPMSCPVNGCRCNDKAWEPYRASDRAYAERQRPSARAKAARKRLDRWLDQDAARAPQWVYPETHPPYRMAARDE